MPDFIVIASDTSTSAKTLDDYVKQDAIFCSNKRLADAEGPRVSSNEPAFVRHGEIMMGFGTMLCIREDAAYDRYSRALLAYRPSVGYTVGSYVHLKNKPAADKLLSQIAELLTLHETTYVSSSGSIIGGDFAGAYRIAPADMIDPAPDDKPDRVGIYISGDAAKNIYEMMPGPTRRIKCHEELGPPTKIAGGLECSFDKQRDSYFCSVAVKLDTGKTAAASFCY
jgi:hypothetical protein